MSFNYFRVKREAHLLRGRGSSTRLDASTNSPVEGKVDRRASFPQDLESSHVLRNDDNNNTLPVDRTQTGPQLGLSRLLEEGDSISNGELKARNRVGIAHTKDRMFSGPQTSSTGPRNRSSDLAPGSAEDEQVVSESKPKKQHRLFRDIKPKEPFTTRNQIQRCFLNSWINVLLVAAPAGIGLHFAPVNPIIIFVVNFLAIIPLASMLSFSTEEIAIRTGETLGGLLNATFGNAVELIVALIALKDHQVIIVQTSLIGSILSNLLLVLGMCFFLGGIRRKEQFFNTTVAQTATSMLALAVASTIVPSVFDQASDTSASDVAALSRGTSIILLVVYAAYLFFQLKTHHAVFSETSQKVAAKPFSHHFHRTTKEESQRRTAMSEGPSKVSEDKDYEEEPQLHFYVALGVLAGSTVIIAFCAEFIVDSIDYVTTEGHISKEFLGLILLPIVGNAAEHVTAITVAMKDKMDLAIGVAVGSSMQVALFLIPFMVIVGWGMHIDQMSLSFDLFQVAVLFVAVLLVNYLIADGKSHWLEGMLLMCLYCIIAVCSWWYPTKEEKV